MRWRCGTCKLEVRSKYAWRYAGSAVEVRSKYGRTRLLVRSKCALESRPYSRDNGLERTEKLSCMARLLQPTEPRPPAAQRAFLKLASLVFHLQCSAMAHALLPCGSLMVRSWFARGTREVKYGVGTVPLRFGTLIFFGPVLYTQTSNSLHASVRFIACNRKQ